MDIRFYYDNKEYVDYLKNYEIEHRGYTCVPNVEYANRSKFVYGAVLNINDINYFVPVSSKIKEDQYSMLIQTKEKHNNIKGSLRFKYMIPIPNQCLVKLDIKTMIEPKRQELVLNELAACRKKRDKIFKMASRTYSDVIKYSTPVLRKNSCDFKLLEQAYIEYCIINELEYPQISVQDNALKKLNEIYTDFLNNTHNDFVTQHGDLPQTLDTAASRGYVSKYIVEQLDGGNITESQRESLEDLRQAIWDFEEPLFIQEAEKITEWCEEAQAKAAERLAEHGNQNHER